MSPQAKKPARKRPVKTAPAAAGTLAERIVTAPRLGDAKAARARIAEWLATLPAAAAKPLKALLSKRPVVATLIEALGESSPYLWDLASREPERLLRLLNSNPDKHLTTLLCDHGRAVASANDEADAMHGLRRMKAEAALLIALADIG